MLSGANTYTGGDDRRRRDAQHRQRQQSGRWRHPGAANGSTLAITAGGSYAHKVALALSSINIASGQNVDWSGVIADSGGPGALALTGPGTLILTTTNTYSGSTTISAGTLAAWCRGRQREHRGRHR